MRIGDLRIGDFAATPMDCEWLYPMWATLQGRVYRIDSAESELVDVTDSLPIEQCDLCDDQAAWGP